MKGADNFPADEPKIVEMAAQRFGGEIMLPKVEEERSHERCQVAANGFVLGDACPALWPPVHERKQSIELDRGQRAAWAYSHGAQTAIAQR